jgi:MoaA/NifB/PqqE/SkfB family radical SAM enzyme
MKYPVKNFLKCCVNGFILKRPTPLLMSYEITQKCNAKCSFCGYWRLKNESLGLPFEKIKKIFDKGYDLGCVLLAITGGEPLLRKDIPAVFEYAKKTGFSTILLTNGYLLPKRISELHRYLDAINVSVDFPDSRHDKIRGLDGLLNRIIIGVKKAREYGISVNMNCVMTAQHSLEDIRKLLFMAKQLDSTASFEPVFQTPNPDGSILGRIAEEEADLLKINDWNFISHVADMLLFYKKHGFGKTVLNTDAFLKLMRERADFTCFPFSWQLGIASDGDVTSMCVIGLPKGYLGNAVNQNLRDIWYSERAEMLREKYKHCKLAKTYGCYLFCVAEPSIPFSNFGVSFEYVKRAI